MGLIPAVDCSILEPPTDCTTLFDIGEAVAAAAMIGLEPFIPAADCDPPIESYVSMEKPVAIPGQDMLVVWLASFGPKAGGRPIGECSSGFWPDFEAEWRVELWEHCYPSIDDLGRLPTPDELHRINAHLYAHGGGVYNAVLASWLNKSGVYPPKVQNMTFGPLTPILPDSKVTGWKFTVRTTVA